MRRGFEGIATGILLVGLVAAATLILAGTLYLKQNKKPQSVVQTTVQPSPLPDETTNWKTYTNQKYNFEFKYPENYSIAKENSKQVVLGVNNNNGLIENILTISIDPTTFINNSSYQICNSKVNELPVYPCVYEWKPEEGNKIADVALGGKKATSFQFGDGQDSGFAIVQTMEEPKIEAKMVIAGGGLEYNFNLILSTFKFTN